MGEGATGRADVGVLVGAIQTGRFIRPLSLLFKKVNKYLHTCTFIWKPRGVFSHVEYELYIFVLS